MKAWITMDQIFPIVEFRPGRFRSAFISGRNCGFTTTLEKLIGPVKKGGRMQYGMIQAIGHLPTHYERFARPQRVLRDGSYLFDVHVWDNRKTFRPFVESGLLEMDVREIES